LTSVADVFMEAFAGRGTVQMMTSIDANNWHKLTRNWHAFDITWRPIDVNWHAIDISWRSSIINWHSNYDIKRWR
jgi:hypothetical protein